jgi:hypothetical protein
MPIEYDAGYGHLIETRVRHADIVTDLRY